VCLFLEGVLEAAEGRSVPLAAPGFGFDPISESLPVNHKPPPIDEYTRATKSGEFHASANIDDHCSGRPSDNDGDRSGDFPNFGNDQAEPERPVFPARYAHVPRMQRWQRRLAPGQQGQWGSPDALHGLDILEHQG
jgi:hypothetical protein